MSSSSRRNRSKRQKPICPSPMDLLDTLEAHADECVGMAANMISVKKRIIVVNMELVNVVMLNPVIQKKTVHSKRKRGVFL